MRRIISGLCVLTAVLGLATLASAELKPLDSTEQFKGAVETRIDEAVLPNELTLVLRASVDPAVVEAPTAQDETVIEGTWAPLPYDD